MEPKDPHMEPKALQQVLEMDVRHVWHPLTQHKVLVKTPPKVIVCAEGSTIVDATRAGSIWTPWRASGVSTWATAGGRSPTPCTGRRLTSRTIPTCRRTCLRRSWRIDLPGSRTVNRATPTS